MAMQSSCSYRSKSQICLPWDLMQMGDVIAFLRTRSILSNHTHRSCWPAVWQMTVGDMWSKYSLGMAGSQNCQTHLQEPDVVWEPLTLWFCVQGRHSQSFQWQNVTNRLRRSPLTQSYLKKLIGNTVFRPQCNQSPIAQHTTSFQDCWAAVQSCPHH